MKHSPWQELTPGGEIYEPRHRRWPDQHRRVAHRRPPYLLADKCKQCLLCVPYCPDSCHSGKGWTARLNLTYDHCKGCGICVTGMSL